MPKVMQNIVLLMDPSDEAYNVSWKAGNMYLNRFSIDEDAAFESTGVYHLKKFPSDIKSDFTLEENAKGQRKYILWNLRFRINFL